MDARALTWCAVSMLLGACVGDSAAMRSVDIAAGDAHGCALDELGAVRCWGSNRLGQLGDGTTIDRPSPVSVVGLPRDVTAIDAQGETTCALTTSGDVWCWGQNHHGQLGDGTVEPRSSPVVGTGLPRARALSVGVAHVCVLDAHSRPGCRGWEVASIAPTDSLTVRVAAIEAGYAATCIVDDLAVLTCWGAEMARPEEPIGGVVSVGVGVDHTCAGLTTGSLRCWGAEPGGRGAPASADAFPVSGVTQVAAAVDHLCVIEADGALLCWGKNEHGQLGDGTFAFRFMPEPIAAMAQTADIAVGAAHSCALDDVGRAWCWGDNEFGQLGDGTRIDSLVPVAPQ